VRVADGKKTKSVGGTDVPASGFAYVGDPEKTDTWKLPIHDCAHAQNALARFGQTEGIPASEKEKVARKIVAKAKSCGVDTSGFEKTYLGKKGEKAHGRELSYRTYQITGERKAAEDGRVPVSLSSETPVPRWDGQEILDHSAECVDMTRAKLGLPLLLDHSTREQVGRIEELALDGGKLRGMMRFSQGAKGKEVQQDVLDGIRQEVSLGYDPMERVLDHEDETGPTYRVTRWMPMEGSLTPVPADHTVGVGRSAQRVAEVREQEPVTQGVSMAAAATAADPVELVAAERRRAQEIRDALDTAQRHGIEMKPEEWLNSDKTGDEARRYLFEQFKKRAADSELISSGGGTMGGLGVSARERRRYSLMTALAAAASEDWSKAGFELEVSNALTKQAVEAGHAPSGRGFLMPADVGVDPLRSIDVRRYRENPEAFLLAHKIASRAGLAVGTVGAGQELRFIEPGSFIEVLRNSTKVMSLGATFLPGLQGNIAFPRQITAGTASWQGENPGADVADSNLTLNQLTIQPHILMSSTSYSRQLLQQAVVDVEQLVRQDLTLITAIEIDRAAINGSGAASQPTGILNVAGVGLVALGVNGAQPIWDNFVDLERTVEAANALRGQLGYLSTPGIKARMKKVAQISGTVGIPVWAYERSPLTGQLEGQVNGYRAEASTNVPSTLTKGTSNGICHAVLFGNWAEVLIGQWLAVEIIVDPYRLKKQGMIELTSIVMVDVGLRHAASMATIVDALQ
jgi:HK97 family phage major capsid protein